MRDYRRAHVSGGCYFFTVVTGGRKPLFAEDRNVEGLRECFRRAMALNPFAIDAIVILPDTGAGEVGAAGCGWHGIGVRLVVCARSLGSWSRFGRSTLGLGKDWWNRFACTALWLRVDALCGERIKDESSDG